jgi:putative ABC transport system permease protein
MWILKLAGKNIWRNKTRTLIAMAAIYFAVLLCTVAESLKEGIFDNLVNNLVSRYTGHIQVHKKGYQNEQVLDNSFNDSPELQSRIKGVRAIAAVAPRIESFGLASSNTITTGCMIEGIDPEAENAITSLKANIIEGRYAGRNESVAMLARGLAERLQLGVGDTVLIIGQGYHGAVAAGKYRVCGMLRCGSPQLNDKLLYLPLPAAQEFFDAAQKITAFIVTVLEKEQLAACKEHLASLLGADYEVMTWEELLPDVKQHIETDAQNMRIFQGILYLLVSMGVFSTLLMMMMERKYETGLLLAIGMTKRKLMLLFVYESLLTVSAGCLAGLMMAIPLVKYLKQHPIRMSGETAKAYERFGFEAVFPASDSNSIFLGQTGIVLLIGFILSVYPLVFIIRLNAVKAMRK